jgi:hypothetical protein
MKRIEPSMRLSKSTVDTLDEEMKGLVLQVGARQLAVQAVMSLAVGARQLAVQTVAVQAVMSWAVDARQFAVQVTVQVVMSWAVIVR